MVILITVSDTGYAQVQGNSVSQGVSVGSQRAGRGTAMLESFNRYSTGVNSVIPQISRPSRDLLFYENRVGRQGAVSGVPGVGARRSTVRPMNTGLITPGRPSLFNKMLFAGPIMMTAGNRSRSPIFTVGPSRGSVQSVLSNVTPFTIKPQEMLRPDIQQRRSGVGLLRGRLSMAQRQSLTRKNALTLNLLTSQKPLFSRNPTIFDMGRRIQNSKQTPMSIFNIR